MSTRALILCAGLGTRLGKIAISKPKPLIDVQGVPCVVHQLRKLESLGVKEVVINTHKNHEQFESALHKLNLGLSVTLSNEPRLLGTLGTLRKHLDFLARDNFWVLHGDNVFTDDLRTLSSSASRFSGEIVGALGIFRTIRFPEVGIIKTSSQDLVTFMYEKSRIPHGFWANSATFLLHPRIKRVIGSLREHKTDISGDLIPQLYGRLISVQLKGKFIDIGTPKNLSRARKIKM